MKLTERELNLILDCLSSALEREERECRYEIVKELATLYNKMEEYDVHA